MKFIVTGTHAYGPATENSDLDLVTKMGNHVKTLIYFLKEKGIPIYQTREQAGYGHAGGFYFNISDIQVNIILAESDFEFKFWKVRTERMKKLLPIHNRAERLAEFNNVDYNLHL